VYVFIHLLVPRKVHVLYDALQAVPTILLSRTSSESSDIDPESDLEKTENKHIVKNIHDQDHDPSAEDELIAR